MFSYLPHSEMEIQAMLEAIGIGSIDELFSDIPESIRLKQRLNLPSSMAETDVMARISGLAQRNSVKTLFAGGGQYDHIIPSLVNHLTSRSEFVTAYTPYQPEISQGILQALFEFQSAMAEITGFPVSNASLYDGHTAAVEASVMALNAKRRARTILVAETLHPHTRSVLNTYFRDLDVDLVLLPTSAGRVSFHSLTEALESLGNKVAGVLVQTPNFYGALEDLTDWSTAIHAVGARLIISSHPLSLGILTSPVEWGGDIAVGDTQALGLPPYFGGPSAGFITCEKGLMRQMPGRIVGETVDSQNRRAFVLTLQAREQHIKRERATSNICTNQTLAALTNLVYLTTLGPQGYVEVSRRNIQAATALRDRLVNEIGLENYTPGPIFNEFTLRIPTLSKKWDDTFAEAGIFPGFRPSDLDKDIPKDLFTISVTEKRTPGELDLYVECAREALG